MVSDAQLNDAQPSDAQPSDAQPSDAQPSDGSDSEGGNATERLRAAFDELKAAYAREPNPRLSDRRKWLVALLALARENTDAVARAASDDFGHRSLHESKLGEGWVTVSNLSYIIDHFESWVEPRGREVALPLWFGRAEVRAQAKGVVGIIAPWNYPFMLAVQQLAGALAAGNRVLLKLSEHTPKTSALLAGLLRARLPSDMVRVFVGGSDEGEALSELPLDHLLFTGSATIGQRVYQAAARHMVPVTLEMGGKSPAILHESYSAARFAKSIVSGKCFSAGQSCVAPDYLLVPRAQQQRVADALVQRFAHCYPTLGANPDYSAVQSAARRDRLRALRDDAVQRGARAQELNPAAESFGDSNKFPLTLLFDVPDDARVMQEEVFGPLLPVVPYDSLKQALDFVNARPRPLALYYFDDRAERVEQVLNSTVSGGVTVNDTLLHFICDELPRGTIGASGIGAYYGRASFDVFSHQKSVFHQSRINGIGFLLPPYGRKLDWILRWLIRR